MLPLKRCADCLDGKRIPIDVAQRVKGPYPYWGAGSIRSYVEYLYGKFVEYLAGMPNYTGARAGVTAARKVRKQFCAKWSTVPLERYDELVAFLKAEIDKTVAGRAMRKVKLYAYKTEKEFLSGQKANSGM